MTDTRQKLLDAAERLMSQNGYAATSLRQIIADAGVNLASVHYHFGSKEEMLDELVMRRAGPVNEERLAMLDRAEAEGGSRGASLERILEAFLAPAFSVRATHPQFVTLMGRLYGEAMMGLVVRKHFHPMVERFQAALRRALPDLSEQELGWRIHFMIGVMVRAMFGPPDGLYVDDPSTEELIGRMVTFVSAGFRARVGQRERVEVE